MVRGRGTSERIIDEVEAVLGELEGRSVTVVAANPLPGGCVSDARALQTDRGDHYFLKSDQSAPPGFFAAEAHGLRALGAMAGVRTPDVIGWSDTSGAAWLLLEHVAAGSPTRRFWSALGAMVRALHDAAQPGPGFETDNYIGSLPQDNGPLAEWSSFWRDRRIVPQLELAFAGRRLDAADHVWRRLLDALPTALAGAPASGRAALLHGDFWSGNVYPDTSGHPVLIDPAAYRGDAEVDIAMSELFGGFAPEFYQAYQANGPLDPEYLRVRRAVYQLYPLLVHVNLFGGSYASPARHSAETIVRTAGLG